MSLNDEWNKFIIGDTSSMILCEPMQNEEQIAPIYDNLYISTKTKVLYLNQTIDLNEVFWRIPITEYWKQTEGVIKKQMKIISKTNEEFDEYQNKLKNCSYYREHIIKHIDNPTARRIKYKNERKITIGISKKDIMTYKLKPKNAFYNCFALIIRFLFEDEYKEIHVKVFNTGKLEIPGVINNSLLEIVKCLVLKYIQPHITNELLYIDENRQDENVLINSNFNCGFYINRVKLHEIIKSPKYGIETAFDPCSYPGVKCKFYYNNHLEHTTQEQKGKILQEDQNMKLSDLIASKKYTEVSFMMFRTGSCLIVGNCSEKILLFVFEFIKTFLTNEYNEIQIMNDTPQVKVKTTKLRKKNILVTKEYFDKQIIPII
jgi:hypothetical protein